MFFDFGMTFCSIFTLVAISVDRYWSVHWSHHYRLHNNWRKAAIFIAAVWCVDVSPLFGWYVFMSACFLLFVVIFVSMFVGFCLVSYCFFFFFFLVVLFHP